MTTKHRVQTSSVKSLQKLLGIFDENLKTLIKELGVEIYVDQTAIEISGDSGKVHMASQVIERLLELIDSGETVDKGRILYCIELVKEGSLEDITKLLGGVIAINSRGKHIKCKTAGQWQYVNAIEDNTIVFGIGPAGTGKTYLSVIKAVSAYKNKQVEKIILTRPAVEAGEKLGFLPGDLQMKVDPYLRPLYDALQEMFGLENYTRLLEKGIIEIAPLAYMRGRTLNNAFIILDEAQNTTLEQMKMFLTRMGEGSKLVVNGDITQIDLNGDRKSGLKHAVSILKDIDGIKIVELSYKDIVRHPLVMEIVKAYNRENTENRN